MLLMELRGGTLPQQALGPPLKSQDMKGVGRTVHTCNPRIKKPEAGGKNETKANLGYIAGPRLKIIKDSRSLIYSRGRGRRIT